jgi:hypothetical protein
MQQKRREISNHPERSGLMLITDLERFTMTKKRSAKSENLFMRRNRKKNWKLRNRE